MVVKTCIFRSQGLPLLRVNFSLCQNAFYQRPIQFAVAVRIGSEIVCSSSLIVI